MRTKTQIDGSYINTWVFPGNLFFHGRTPIAQSGMSIDPQSANIDEVLVSRDYQGRGIGTSLVRRCLKLARRFGCRFVELSPAEGKESFYEQFGFYRYGRKMRYDLN